MSDAIIQALRMERQERIDRWRVMMDNVEKEDVIWWRKRFTSVLMGETQETEPAE